MKTSFSQTIMVAVLSAGLLAPAFAAQVRGAIWGLEDAGGPQNWGAMGYTLCASGREQSPVNIPDSAPILNYKIEFNYRSSTVESTNNGHTVKFNYNPGSYIVVESERYELIQFHFHSPSENTYGGRHLPLEMHLVHKSRTKGLAVIAVFMKQGYAEPNESLNRVFGALAGAAGLTLTDSSHYNVADLLPGKRDSRSHLTDSTHSAAHLAPADQNYHYFKGSLTTPPCTEGVKWFVMNHAPTASYRQIERFRSIYRNNVRPVQPMNQRKFLTQ